MEVFFHPEKRYELLAYLMSAAFLFGYYFLGYLFAHKLNKAATDIL